MGRAKRVGVPSADKLSCGCNSAADVTDGHSCLPLWAMTDEERQAQANADERAAQGSAGRIGNGPTAGRTVG